MKSKLSLPKKMLFTGISFVLFLLILEGVLTLIPVLLGFQQRGNYDTILEGGTTIVCLGDSVTYGYGLKNDESWPAQLQQALKNKGTAIQVVNRAVSGMNSTEMLQRERKNISRIAQRGVRPVVLIMIGHNDLAGAGWRQWSAQQEVSASASSYRPPRLWRVLRWAGPFLDTTAL